MVLVERKTQRSQAFWHGRNRKTERSGAPAQNSLLVNFVPDAPNHAKPQLPPAFSLENFFLSRIFEVQYRLIVLSSLGHGHSKQILVPVPG
jgi:hypothetical protein